MDLILVRKKIGADGVFGELLNARNDESLFVTLEHAYPSEDGFWAKIPKGEYLCKRGVHQLHSSQPFTTFEVMDVPNRYGILIHWGNWNSDSNGCILLGIDILTYLP